VHSSVLGPAAARTADARPVPAVAAVPAVIRPALRKDRLEINDDMDAMPPMCLFSIVSA